MGAQASAEAHAHDAHQFVHAEPEQRADEHPLGAVELETHLSGFPRLMEAMAGNGRFERVIADDLHIGREWLGKHVAAAWPRCDGNGHGHLRGQPFFFCLYFFSRPAARILPIPCGLPIAAARVASTGGRDFHRDAEWWRRAECGSPGMQVLFIRQSFPGQYRHLAAALRQRGGNRVVAIGGPTASGLEVVELHRYDPMPADGVPTCHS